jgi:hypothetical protein
VSAVTEAHTDLHASLINQGAQSGQLVLGSLKDPSWQPLPAESANPVKVARRYVASLLAEVAKIDSDHVDDVVLAVSELVTNAICHAIGEGQLSVCLVIRPRWTHLYVVDPDPTVPESAPTEDDDRALFCRRVRVFASSTVAMLRHSAYHCYIQCYADRRGSDAPREKPVNRVGYGAMQLAGPNVWGPPDDPESARRVLRLAVELGVTFFDTANAYGPRTVNRLIGEALRPFPEGVIVGNKVGAQGDVSTTD